MHVEAHLPLEELKRLEHYERDAGQARRLRIVVLAMEGWTAPAIAMAVGLSRRVCERWVAQYNADGQNGLNDQRGQHASVPLTADQTKVFRERVESGPTSKDVVCSLRGKNIQRILANEFGVQRSLSRSDPGNCEMESS